MRTGGGFVGEYTQEPDGTYEFLYGPSSGQFRPISAWFQCHSSGAGTVGLTDAEEGCDHAKDLRQTGRPGQ